MNTMTESIEQEKIQKPSRLPKDIKPSEYNVNILLNTEKRVFHGKVSISATAVNETSTLILHAEDMNIESISVQGENGERINGNLEYTSPILKYTLDREIKKEEEIIVDIEYSSDLSESMHGFYTSEYKRSNESKFIYSTQFEPTYARQALPCWDEPEYKAVFNVTITAPSGLVVLSNAKEIEQSRESNVHLTSEYVRNKLAENQKDIEYDLVVFEPTPKMSTYLLAWVIGEIECIEQGNVRVFSPLGEKEHGAFSLDVAVKCLEFFNEYFGIDYVMNKLDMVAIPEFSAGAMENWGLVTYRSNSLHYIEGQSTEMQKLYIAETVCHELAHQWFGNLVTMQWWNDLWLNEGFATWAGTLATATLAKSIGVKYNPWEVFLESDITAGMAMDSRVSTHAVNQEVKSDGDITSIFDAISYSKGGSLIHMLAKYIGDAPFQAGLVRYIRDNKYKNTVTADLWNAIDPDRLQNISEAMNHWINTAGFPCVTVSSDEKNLLLSQERYLPKDAKTDSSDSVWSIFLTVKRFDTKNNTHVESLLFDQKTMSLPASDAPLIINPESSGFYRVHYSRDVFVQRIMPLLMEQGRLSDFDRFGIFRDAISFTTNGHEKVDYVLALLPCIHPNEKYIALAPLVRFLQMLCSRFIDVPQIVAAAQRALTAIVEKYVADGDFETLPEDVEESKLKILAVSALSLIEGSIVHKYIDEKLLADEQLDNVHPEFKSAMYNALGRFGGEKEYKYLLNIIEHGNSEPERLRATAAIAFSRAKSEDAFNLFVTKNALVKNQDKIRMLMGLASNEEREKILNKFFESFEQIKKNFTGAFDHIARFTEAFISYQNTKEAIEVAKSFFANNDHQNDSWNPAVKKGIEEAEVACAFRERNMETLQQWASE
ncbi:hypothetical protein NEFER03_1235 [Nematocida sp. LUAm3]|nr:hypothetical protein NEFER03_1235 [Nematocida sp. LUAm3]KAI5175844.1 hypothetical protein NEFER02_1713 [Nematocida sp. LUAm2]KAI5178340.1 hypothetical protein NEFER01_1507 [Nematocida sp. LUAm1]